VDELNQIIHQPVRLRIMAALTSLDTGRSVDFTALRDFLKATDGNLGAHLRKLEGASYISVEKAFIDRKPRTQLAVTALGQQSFAEHVAALAAILQSQPELDESA
jgi:DNA-binding MarR family transcriptional regulator